MIVRAVTAADYPRWAEMRRALWPDEDPVELEQELPGMFELDPPYRVFVAEDGGILVGFIEMWIRSCAEGGPVGPAAYVEGIWVDPQFRRKGVASALLERAEQWARREKLCWIGSDAMLDNILSHSWHKASGFTEVERLVVFGKRLD